MRGHEIIRQRRKRRKRKIKEEEKIFLWQKIISGNYISFSSFLLSACLSGCLCSPKKFRHKNVRSCMLLIGVEEEEEMEEEENSFLMLLNQRVIIPSLLSPRK